MAMRLKRDEARDHTPICKWCGAVWCSGLDYCNACGKKVVPDRRQDRSGERDMVEMLGRGWGIRVREWLRQTNVSGWSDHDDYEDIRDQMFTVDQERD